MPIIENRPVLDLLCDTAFSLLPWGLLIFLAGLGLNLAGIGFRQLVHGCP
jgi:hypothetical protein